MGYCAIPMPQMHPFSIEDRHETFYLHVPAGHGHVYGCIDEDSSGTIELRIDDIPALRATLDQVERLHHRHDNRYEWAVREPNGDLRPVQIVQAPDLDLSDALAVLARNARPDGPYATALAAAYRTRISDTRVTEARKHVVNVLEYEDNVRDAEAIVANCGTALGAADLDGTNAAAIRELRDALVTVLDRRWETYADTLQATLGVSTAEAAAFAARALGSRPAESVAA
jgi:hypothetical protein